MIEDYKFQLNELKTEISNVYEKLDTDSVEKKIKEKEQITENPSFWDNHEKAEKIMAEIRKLKKRIEPWKKLLLDYSDLEAMYDLALESSSSDDENEFIEMYENLKQEFEKLNVLKLLSGEVDDSAAFITIHSGAGGTEAEDWAYMLSRMYTRWAERHGFKIEIVDVLEAEGGIK